VNLPRPSPAPVLIATALSVPAALFSTIAGQPTWIYRAVTAFQIGLLFFSRRHVSNPTYALMLSMVWYTLFWTIRDAFFGFYAQQGPAENMLALAPAVLALTWYAWPSAKGLWWKLLLATSTHVSLCLVMVDTDNELLAVLSAAAFSLARTANERLYLGALFWYQFYLAVSKYMPLDYPDRNAIYFVALTPFLVANLTIFIKRTSRLE
jgi:hypothetical protein